MTLLHTKIEECAQRAKALPVGATYALPELFPNDWTDFCEGVNPAALGRAFSLAIEVGEITHSRFLQVDKSPRQSRYIRVEIFVG